MSNLFSDDYFFNKKDYLLDRAVTDILDLDDNFILNGIESEIKDFMYEKHSITPIEADFDKYEIDEAEETIKDKYTGRQLKVFAPNLYIPCKCDIALLYYRPNLRVYDDNGVSFNNNRLITRIRPPRDVDRFYLKNIIEARVDACRLIIGTLNKEFGEYNICLMKTIENELNSRKNTLLLSVA